MELTDSKKIGRFVVHRSLGEGLQGKVYLCWDSSLERQVALKLITPAVGDLAYMQEVMDEARIAARISHPNVVSIFEVGTHEKAPLLVFEFVDGVTLKEYLKEHGRFSEKDALSIMVRIAAGLRVAHEQNIVHLDLSPNNIMMDAEARPRIMDFGLARVIASIGSEEYENCIAGTPRYMSPEQIGGKTLTPASDIFTLGLLFYQILTGEPAIRQRDLGDITHAIEHAEIDWGRLQHLGISPGVNTVLRDMLQIDPALRYPSAVELVNALDEVINLQLDTGRGSLALEFLMRRLQRRPEFPACSHNIIEINRLTDAGANTDFKKLGAVIARDFSITNRIMKIANSVIFDRRGDGVKTISQAITRLGLNLLRMICNGLLLFNQATDKDDELKDRLVASFVAGLIARHVTGTINHRVAEEAFICALFHNLGTHLLVFYLTDEYHEIQEMIKNGVEPAKAEQAVLSTTSATLGVAVAQKWNFPPSITDCMTHLPAGILEKPASTEDLLRHAANLSNELCDLIETHEGHDSLLLALNHFLERHHGIYRGDVGSLTQITNAAAKKFAQLAPELGVNFTESRFCQRLDGFAGEIYQALGIEPEVEEEEEEETPPAVMSSAAT